MANVNLRLFQRVLIILLIIVLIRDNAAMISNFASDSPGSGIDDLLNIEDETEEASSPGSESGSTSEDTSIPSAVNLIKAQSIDQQSILLEYSSSGDSDLSHYDIYRNSVLIASIDTTYYIDNSLASSTEYTYHVVVVDTNSKESLNSNSRTGKTKANRIDDCDMIVYTHSSTYIAIDNESTIVYSSSVASIVLNSATDSVGLCGGGTVYVRDGTYTITQAIYLDYENTNFVGDTRENTVIQCDITTLGFLFLARKSNSMISTMKFIGPGWDSAGNTLGVVSHGNETIFQYLDISETNNDPIQPQNGNNITIRHNLIHDVDEGIEPVASLRSISNISIYNNTAIDVYTANGEAFELHCQPGFVCDNIDIYNNTINRVGRGFYTYNTGNFTNLKFRNNNLTDVTIGLLDASSGAVIKDYYVFNNTFTNVFLGIQAGVTTMIHNMTIANNTFSNINQEIIESDFGLNASRIEFNTFDTTGTNYDIIRAKNMNYTTIKYNTFNGSGRHAMNITLSYNNSIYYNQFNQSSSQAVYFSTATQYNLLYNNSFFNNFENLYDIAFKNYYNDSTSGNFYDDYGGVDGNSDGIGDTSYTENGAIDYKPLMTRPV